MNKWEETLGVKYPECKMTGQCCRMASPSVPPDEMLKKAAEGDSFARDFLSIFKPYESREKAYALFPELVERSLAQAKKSDKYQNSDQVVFYRCIYLKGKNECQVYEDRPQLCRDYPDTPFLVMPPGCAFENWSKECKQKYKNLKNELDELKHLKKILLEEKQSATPQQPVYSMYLLSPVASWLR